MKKWFGALIVALALTLAGLAGTSSQAAPFSGTKLQADSAVELAAKKGKKAKKAKKAKKKAKKRGKKKKAGKAGKCGAFKYYKKGKCMDARAKK